MAKNDKVLIDGIIDDRIQVKLPSDKRDEAFEYFAFEQILKDYDLSKDEILDGSVDGRNDGGIDGFFILINGHPLIDLENFNWPRSGAVLEVWIITAKLHDTFRQAPLDNLVASITELFDFSIDTDKLSLDYSEEVKRQRENLKFAYRKVSPRLTEFKVNFAYASRGDTEKLGEAINARAHQVTNLVKEFFHDATCSFEFNGSSELIAFYRKTPNFTLELPFIEDLSSGQTYILLVPIIHYYNFLQDNGKLRRYLFDSNVRDFMGLNQVNEDINNTLRNENSPDFWWLNNGVTILATGASVIGKSIQVRDIQIVNGLQTSESIFRYFSSGGSDPKNRCVLVKVIVSNDSEVRDTIIRATNNQTPVEMAALHATDRIQRDVEDILKRHDVYYERRTNFYKNQGVSPEKIVTPLYVASAFVNLVLKAPAEATRLKNKFMRSEPSYGRVFSENIDLNIWPKITKILKKTDAFLESMRPGNSHSENFLKSRRQVVSYLTVSRLLGTFNFGVDKLLDFDLNKYTEAELRKSLELVNKSNAISGSGKRLRILSLTKILTAAASEWSIVGIERFTPKSKAVSGTIKESKYQEGYVPITMDFAMKVHELLPSQPWKPGIDKQVISTLGCSRPEYFEAVKLLITEGLRYQQRDGVVYDEDGNVLQFDTDRVDPQTMKLRD